MDPVSWIVIMYVSMCLTVDPVVFSDPQVNPPGKYPETGALIPDGVQYERISVLLVAEVQRLMHRIEVLEGKPH